MVAATGGYWLYVPHTLDVMAYFCNPSPPAVHLTAPGGQWIMIGNPLSVPAALDLPGDGDVVYTYDPQYGYQQVQSLMPDEGGWLYSVTGGTVALTPLS